MEINYIGEHLWAGKLGHFFIVLAFVSALMAAFGYFFAAKNEETFKAWKNISRSAFTIHIISVFGIIGTLLFMLYSNMFEYNYVWEHSNSVMPMRYILSSFWEGQEGSFLLWLFSHAVLGLILMRGVGKWEAPVFAVIALVQVFLVSMVLGTNIGEFRLGSNPFVLLRENPEFMKLPFMQDAKYLARLDGRGMNPLLQNYWMTIHPPITFIGFASTLVPFAFAIAGFWKKKYTEWIKPAIPWAFFSVMILGAGILMGGAWAYEALSFGGFWSWDPVENSSLVPWLVMVGAAHVMVVQKNRGQSLVITFVLTTTSFLLILYSTFLTRSGILGETSVHAFTDLGMSGQLLIYMLSFAVLAAIMLIARWKELPKTKDEDSLYSREFWMFVGALVLVISCFQITFTTSIPVWNKLFGTNLAPPLDATAHYHSFQIPLAIMLSILIAVSQYFKYKKTDPKKLVRAVVLPLVLTTIATAIIGFAMHYTNVLYIAMLFSTLFLILANLDFWFRVLKGKLKIAGASIAHVGFGMILLGALLSTSKTEIISMNTSGMDVESLGSDGDYSNRDNILLMKGDTLRMGEYFVTYTGKKKEGVNVFYEVDYFTQPTPGNYELAFTLHPRVQTNPRMGNIAEPDTRHFLHKDIYTFVTYAEIEKEETQKEEEYKNTKTEAVAPGDTIFAGTALVVFEGFNRQIDLAKNGLSEGDIAVGVELKAIDISGKNHFVQPLYVIRDRSAIPVPAEIEELGLRFIVSNIIPDEGKVEIALYERPDNYREFIVLKAMIFPWINILWAGCIVMVIGTVMAIRRRLKG